MKKAALGTVAILLTLLAPQAQAQAPTISNVNFCTPNGVKLYMDLYLPVSNVSTPIVVEVHGGGWVSGDKSGQWVQDLAPLLDAHGIALASIQYRVGWKFPAAIVDVACAVRYIRANALTYNIDSSQIGAFGDSAGGHLSLLLALTNGATQWGNDGEWTGYPSNVQAVVDWFGPTNLNQHSDFSSQVNQLIYQTFGILPSKLAAASPMSYINPNAPPILSIHGLNDSLVAYHQSAELASALTTTHLLIPVNNAGHSWVQVGPNPISPSIAQIEDMTVEWFTLTL